MIITPHESWTLEITEHEACVISCALLRLEEHPYEEEAQRLATKLAQRGQAYV